MNNHCIKGLCLLLLTILLINRPLMAQPFNLTESVQPVELNFTEYKKEADAKAKGRISINTFSQDKDTAYYFIKGLSMYAPTYFCLNSADAEADIKVNLCKENWHTAHKTGTVQGKALWKSQFKTEGDFGIMVIAHKKPTRYALVVWTGNEMNVTMPAVFKTATTADLQGGGWFKNNMLTILLGTVAVLVILFLLFKLKKKK